MSKVNYPLSREVIDAVNNPTKPNWVLITEEMMPTMRKDFGKSQMYVEIYYRLNVRIERINSEEKPEMIVEPYIMMERCKDDGKNVTHAFRFDKERGLFYGVTDSDLLKCFNMCLDNEIHNVDFEEYRRTGAVRDYTTGSKKA